MIARTNVIWAGWYSIPINFAWTLIKVTQKTATIIAEIALKLLDLLLNCFIKYFFQLKQTVYSSFLFIDSEEGDLRNIIAIIAITIGYIDKYRIVINEFPK